MFKNKSPTKNKKHDKEIAQETDTKSKSEVKKAHLSFKCNDQTIG